MLPASSHFSVAAQTNVVRYPATPPGLILSGVTVAARRDDTYTSAASWRRRWTPAKAKLPPAEMAKLTMADFGDTRTQTISVLGKIKTILAAHGFDHEPMSSS